MRTRDILIQLLLFGGTAYALWARPAFAIPVFTLTLPLRLASYRGLPAEVPVNS
jgi:hypothetical protein